MWKKLASIQTPLQLVSIAAFAIVTVEAKPLTMSSVARPATEGSCCARMMQSPAACPPVSGMDGTSCCNMQLCLQLFFHTTELRLKPPFLALRWDDFEARHRTLLDQPPVPPPRA